MLLAGLGIALGGLVITILLAFSLGRGFQPAGAQAIPSSGGVGARQPRRTRGAEFGRRVVVAAKGFNRMAETLQTNQTDLQRRIQEATVDLEVKKDEAEQANRDKSNFLAAVSHDLRQPMHAIGLFSATLKQRVSTNEQRELSAAHRRFGERFANHVRRVVEIYRDWIPARLNRVLESCDLAAILEASGPNLPTPCRAEKSEAESSHLSGAGDVRCDAVESHHQ